MIYLVLLDLCFFWQVDRNGLSSRVSKENWLIGGKGWSSLGSPSQPDFQSQSGWGWKEPLEMHQPNPPANVGCIGWHPGGFGVAPENETPHTLWVTQCWSEDVS